MRTSFIKLEKGRISDVKFEPFGCAAAIAGSSMVSGMAKGKSLLQAKSITRESIAEALEGLPKEKMHCSNLAAEALAKAIEDHEENSLL